MLRLRGVQVIASDVEEAIPTGAIMFKSDLPSQLHELLFRKLIAQTRIQLVGNIRWRVNQGVSQLNYQSLSIIKRCHVVAASSAQLFIAQTGFSAHGRIDVYSEWTTDARRGADSSKLNVTQGDQSLPVETGLHRNTAPY